MGIALRLCKAALPGKSARPWGGGSQKSTKGVKGQWGPGQGQVRARLGRQDQEEGMENLRVGPDTLPRPWQHQWAPPPTCRGPNFPKEGVPAL